jgi:hypothetical protein
VAEFRAANFPFTAQIATLLSAAERMPLSEPAVGQIIGDPGLDSGMDLCAPRGDRKPLITLRKITEGRAVLRRA